MAADTFTSGGIGLLQMGTGNDNNSWGNNLNTSVIQIIEDAVSGRLDTTVTGGTLDLSGSPPPTAPSQARYSLLGFNGTLTADQTVIVPNLSKMWVIENNTSGAFVLLFQTPSGIATQIPQGTMKIVRCNGSNGMRRLDADEVGRFEDYGMASIPAGMLACDNTAYKRTRYPDLFAKIGTTWGLGIGGDITTFGTPLLTDTGRFRRSSTGSLTVGTYQVNQNLTHTHTGTATGTTDATNIDHTHNQQGTFVTGIENQTHTHNELLGANTVNGGNLSSFSYVNGSGGTNFGTTGTENQNHNHNVTISGTTGSMNQSNPHNHTFTSSVFTTASSGGTEARPEAAVVLACIRY
jgi:hypothetical protein